MTVYLLHFGQPIGDLGNPRGQGSVDCHWQPDVYARWGRRLVYRLPGARQEDGASCQHGL